MRATRSEQAVRTSAVAFALVARSLGEDPDPLRDPAHVVALRSALTAHDDPRLRALASDVTVAFLPAADLAGRWVRWFDLGRVPPYEGSNVAVTAGGITPRLADVAGFYRAFGMNVVGNRPDHLVAELEFMALVLVHEADALASGDGDRAEVVGDAARAFLRDHLGGWVDAWASRVAAVPELEPWAPHARVAAALVAAEAAARNVIPTRTDAVLVGDAGVATDDEPLLACGDETV